MEQILYLAPEGFDYSSNQLTEGFHLLEKMNVVGSFHCTAKVVHHGSAIEDLQLRSKESCIKLADSYSIILISSGGDLKFYDDLNRLPKSVLHKVVFVDGHDGNGYLVDPSKIGLYLKRELRYPEANDLKWKNVFPLQFGVYDFHFRQKRKQFKDRDIDVSFVAFGGSSQMRDVCAKEINQRCKHLKTYVSVAKDRQPLSIEEYRDIAERSKVIVSVPGAGIDTLRYWEAFGFGAVTCSIDITKILQIPYAPLGRLHCLYFDSWQSMAEQATAVVNDERWWQRITKAGSALIRDRHTTVARAHQVLEYCRLIRS